MAGMNLDAATVAWLEEHLAQFGGLARHVPRTIDEARRRYIASTLGVSLGDHLVIGKGFASFQVSGALSGDQLQAMITTPISLNGETYRFSEVDPTRADGPEESPMLDVRYTAA